MKFIISILLLIISFTPALGQSTPQTDTSDISLWQLVSIKGRPVHYAEEQQPITLQINKESRVVSGHSGCNTYHANYKHGPLSSSRGLPYLQPISISKPVASCTFCPDDFMKLEQQYLPLLSRVTHIQLQDSVLILYQKEKELLRYDHLVR